MDPDPAQEAGEPEVTVETVPDNIETRHSMGSMGMMDRIWFSILGYFSNPWALLILIFLLYKLYRHLRPYVTEPISERYRQWQEQREQAADEAAYKKNPDLFHNKMEIMEAARLRLQARYDEDAIRAEEKRQEAEDRKTEQEIKEWEDHLAGKGYKNRADRSSDKGREALEQQARVKGKKGFRPDYNPLMGGGGGGGFRPAAKKAASGGG